MKKIITLILYLSFILYSLIVLPSVNAQNRTIGTGTVTFNLTQPQGLGITSGIGANAQAEGIVQTILVNVITIFFAVGGIGVVIYFVWGAVDWILSGGDKEKINSARKKMTNSLIGLTLLALSYVIINIVGQVVGFNPLGYLQLRGLGDPSTPVINQ